MRTAFTVVYLVMILSLLCAMILARRSHKGIGKYVSQLDAALIPPVIGNLIIICSSSELISTIGYYFYFIGMDVFIFTLLRFTIRYCSLSGKICHAQSVMFSLLGIDAVQMLLNPFLGHAFGTELVMVEEMAHYQLVPYIGQIFHRAVNYGILAAVLIVFAIKTIRSSRVYMERYCVIMLIMIFGGLWQIFHIFSGSPLDCSMIVFGVFGITICYFSVYYRPLRLLDRLLANIASELPEALFFFQQNGQCIWVNDPALALTGLQRERLDEVPARLAELLDVQITEDMQFPQRIERGSGEDTLCYDLDRHTVTDDRGRVAGSVLSIRDMTAEQRQRHREMYNTIHDALTGLYTREYLYSRIREVLTADTEHEYMIVYASVRNFKMVNDIFGPAIGDQALCQVADWVRHSITPHCTYGRLVGGAFGICIRKGEFSAEWLEHEAVRILIGDGSASYSLLIHFGIYEATDRDLDVALMFDRAHLALSSIKDEYKTHVAYYDSKLREKVLWNQGITAQLKPALESMQIRPYLQPIADSSGKIVGAEALARWIHPEHGFLSPGSFIPVFENNGMIVEVDRHIWRCACQILADWRECCPDFFISINISPKDFYFADVFAEITGLVEEFGIEPRNLRVEITETVMMTDIEDKIRLLGQFREAGFIVEIDDFGSGYSSLNMLKDIPVDVLKIDMKFLSGSKDEARAHKIVKNVIQLAEDLEVASLTEGVETQEQYEVLAKIGCQLFQGYYFAKPMPVEDFEKLMQQ